MKNLVKYNQPKSFFQLFFDDQVTKNNYENRYQVKPNFPPTNIKEDSKVFTINMAVPGMKKNDFDISLEKNVLTVKSENEVNNGNDDVKIQRMEFDYTNFERSFTLPTVADAENIQANYDQGILTLIIPKKEKANTVKQIEIK